MAHTKDEEKATEESNEMVELETRVRAQGEAPDRAENGEPKDGQPAAKS